MRPGCGDAGAFGISYLRESAPPFRLALRFAFAWPSGRFRKPPLDRIQLTRARDVQERWVFQLQHRNSISILKNKGFCNLISGGAECVAAVTTRGTRRIFRLSRSSCATAMLPAAIL